MIQPGAVGPGTAGEGLIDPVALAAHLRERLPGEHAREPVSVERHRAGHSNETFFVTRGPERWVLRRSPLGAFLPTAHDVVREHRVLDALAATPVRSPRPVLLCEDPSVIGAAFYLMERVDGTVLRDRLPAWGASPESTRMIADELVDALVELHDVDWMAAGLEGFGRPAGYLERQVRRWTTQLALTEPLTRHVGDLHVVGRWLEGNVPPTAAATVVHGDYKLDNVAFAVGEEGPRLVAVFDWEMSTLGDPLADVGWMLAMWRGPARRGSSILDRLTVTAERGFPRRADLLERYSTRSGRNVADTTFYIVLAMWKLAVLLEGSYARHLAGMTDDPFFALLEEGVPAIAAEARSLISGGR